MKNIFLLSILLIAGVSQINGQTFTSSNLPIVIINTDDDAEIPTDPKIWADMKIVYRGEGQTTLLTDQNNTDYLDFNNRIKIETRGSSSADLEKKQFSFTTYDDSEDKDNVSLLGMPKENDWILNSLPFDTTMVRDYVSYNLSRAIGQYASRTQYCEIVLNGEYYGLFLLLEKIKADDGRVDINKISESDLTGESVTGGYITKADRANDGDPNTWYMSGYNADVLFVHEVPKPDEATSEQHDYITGEFDRLASTTAANNTSFTNGYPSVIDVPSFVDFMLLNELSANVDAYQLSTFFHKDKNGKLRAGPIWDLNLTFGTDLFDRWEGVNFDRSHTDTWQFDDGDNTGARFWKDLFDDPDFQCYLSKRWNELTQSGQPFNLTSLENRIDDAVDLISAAAAREEERWGVVEERAAEVTKMKAWIADRIIWMNDDLGSFESCSNVSTPELVITKINYHPTASTETSSSAQEFIEITNNGSSSINLTGVYFGGVGLVYQFPAGSSLAAGQSVTLANNSSVYTAKYGEVPFDEYSRALANGGQTISLLDGFGNVIDEVTYDDVAPWPDADGNGFYLQLTNPDLDNNNAANWSATADVEFELAVGDKLALEIQVYPNPNTGRVIIASAHAISFIKLVDLQGRTVKHFDNKTSQNQIDISDIVTGTYLLELGTSNGLITKRIIKQ